MYNMIWGWGTGKKVKETSTRNWYWLTTAITILSFSLLWQRVKCWCQTHWHRVMRCKGESPELCWNAWSIKATDKCLQICLLKAYRPVCSENTQSTWVLWYSLRFPDNKGPKVKEFVSKQRGTLWLSDSIGNWAVTMKHVLCIDLLWNE